MSFIKVIYHAKFERPRFSLEKANVEVFVESGKETIFPVNTSKFRTVL